MPNHDPRQTSVTKTVPSTPLICALDGAFLKTNFRTERLLYHVKRKLDRLMLSNIDLQRLELEQIDSAASSFKIPVNKDVYNFLVKEKSNGRQIILDTKESTEDLNEVLVDHNVFDQSIDISSTLYSEKFDYIGGSNTSEDTWLKAIKKYRVGPKSEKLQGFNGQFHTPTINLGQAIKAVRAYQWLKNLLVFVPIITSQQISNTASLKNALIMFGCFSAIASFGYIVNDLLDLQSDRAHQTKRNRPFASGELCAKHGLLLGTVLLLIAAIGCLFLPIASTWALLSYLLLTIGYSIYLKTKLMIDVVSLGGLFTLRVIGGAAAIQTELSFYLLSFSIFLFSSLGMVKRYAELHNLRAVNKLSARGRGYRVEDMAPVRIIGISLGYMSVFIMGLYINSPLITQYYSDPKVIWFLLPLLTYWLGRLWILANRGEVNEDPLIFAVKDTTSLLVAALSAVILVIAN